MPAVAPLVSWEVRGMTTALDLTMLTQMPLFQGLEAEQLTLLCAQLRQRKVGRGVQLMMVEQEGDVAYIIMSGTVRVTRERADGTEVLIAVRGPGELIGEQSLLDARSRSASVATAEPCTLVWVERATFRSWLQTIPLLGFNLAVMLSRRLRVASAQIEALAALDVYGRVAYQLLALVTDYGQPAAEGAVRLPFRLTQSDLASMVGASRPRVNAALGLYTRQGIVAVDADARITVLDREALARRCN
jgi:CRP/FNR family cyclic AMP-dependent transcriptional regulator